MLKSFLILSVISSIIGYKYSHIQPTFYYSPHHPISQPSFQPAPLVYYPSYQPSYKYNVPRPLPVTRMAQGLEEANDLEDLKQSRLFFGSQLSGVFSRGFAFADGAATLNYGADVKGRITVLQNMFTGNSGNNAVFTLSLDGGATADSKYVLFLLKDADVDNTCGPAAVDDRETIDITVDGNDRVAWFDSRHSEIIGTYTPKRTAFLLTGSLLKHNVDGKGTYKGTYPTKGFVDWIDDLYSGLLELLLPVQSALAGKPLQGVYIPATAKTITGNKISAKGQWFLVMKLKSDYLSSLDLNTGGPTTYSVGCAKLE